MIVAIVGDICPIGLVGDALAEGRVHEVFGDLRDALASSDLAVGNLECPLIASPSPIAKSGPVLGAKVECASGIKAAGFDVVALANNHVLDHGRRGLISTLARCRAAGIDCVGAGMSEDEACQYLVRKINNVRIGIVAMAEAEFCLASGSHCGACHLDPIIFSRMARELRQQTDFILVLTHGGNEGNPFPRPGLRRLCRFLVEEGAGAVLCQHSHCIGCYEEYRGALILYGQGNMLFQVPQMTDAWRVGAMVELRLAGAARLRWQLHFFQQANRWNQTTPYLTRIDPKGRQGQDLLNAVEERNAILMDEGQLDERWRQFCSTRKSALWSRLMMHGNVGVRLNQRGWIQRLIPAKRLRLAANIVRCESHREVLLQTAENDWRKSSENT